MNIQRTLVNSMDAVV